VTTGDAMSPAQAANPRSLAGKVLRYERDGSIPVDNPDPDSPVWARGLRNTQALAWLPDGTLLGAEHGPSGMSQERARTGRDELNVLGAGADLGWPGVIGASGAGTAEPLWVWGTAIAPGGLALLPSADGDETAEALVSGLRGRRLVRLGLASDASGSWRVVHGETLLADDWGRLRAVMGVGADGVLVTSSNRDARGMAGAGDDLLLRLRLPIEGLPAR
jgi:aldose sugar dehydrogenase